MKDLAFHMTEQGFVVSVNGEMATPEFIDQLAIVINNDQDVQSLLTSKLRPSPWVVLEKMQGDIAAEIRVMLGEAPYAASLFDDAQRIRRIEAMKKCALESTGDADRHESWMKMHIESGWVYGETFDPTAKTHPNLLPWDQLPPLTRSKARIFDIVAKAALALDGTN